MSYYTLQPALSNHETGSVYPQVQKMSPGYQYDAINSVGALSREVERFPDYEPNLDHFVLHDKSRPSDLLSVSVIYGGMLISKKFRSVLERFYLPAHKFYPARVKHTDEFHEYYWMHIICNLTSEVNYPKSSFIIYSNYRHDLGGIEILSKNDLEQKTAKVKADHPGETVSILAERVHLEYGFDKTLDLWEVGGFERNIYISSKMKSTIEEEKITGCHIAPATNIFFDGDDR